MGFDFLDMFKTRMDVGPNVLAFKRATLCLSGLDTGMANESELHYTGPRTLSNMKIMKSKIRMNFHTGITLIEPLQFLAGHCRNCAMQGLLSSWIGNHGFNRLYWFMQLGREAPGWLGSVARFPRPHR